MSFLVAHLTYQFLPPILGGILANAIDRVVGANAAPSRTAKKRSGAKGSDIKAFLAKLGLDWRSGPQGSEGWRRNRRIAHGLVIVAYLLYLTVRTIQTHFVSPSTLYDLLQVSPSIDETGLKSAWRSMSRKYHPDKLGAGGAQGEVWVAMREGYEVLMEPNARMAYDRFGPKSISWSQATTARDYAVRGLQDMATWYGITIAVQIMLAYCRPEMTPGKWLRFYLLALLATVELSLLLSPVSSLVYQITTRISSSLLPFQWIAFLREQWIVGSLAITQLYPLLYGSAVTPTSGADDQIKAVIGIDAKDAEGMKAAMQRMSMLAQEMEVGNVVTFDKRKRLLTREKGGFGGGKASEDKKRETEGDKLVKLLKKEMENHEIQVRLAHSPIGAPLWSKVHDVQL
ncbi:hypothetical protein QFC20_002958 [Naganishia adeliensis]|uniref:Uncharacterized protein n=1 Tax=Naganishia adeliensis TaxID=92952 RepID=A0ACC2WG19_9TREE|nr:hypothetical protein QFC20_002958 [Naganishia adeliensis]